MNPHIIPIVIAAESLVAGIVYLFLKDWLSALYWVSAFTLNVAVIGMAIRSAG